MAMGFRVVGADMPEEERRKYIDDDFDEFMEFTHWRANARLVRAFLEKTAETAEWLQTQGVEIITNIKIEGRKIPATFLKPRGKGHGGALLIRALVKKALEKGVAIYFSTPIKRILKDKGVITGVIAEDKSGKSVQVDAKAVIVASGGYGNSKEMIREYNGFDLGYETGGDLFMLADLKLTGDGIQAAWEAGAASEGMGPHLIFNVRGPGIVGNPPWVTTSEIPVLMIQPHLLVNQQGERFYNEAHITSLTFTGNVLARQKNRCGYLIFDGNIKEVMEKEGIDNISYLFMGKKRLEHIDEDFNHAIEKGNENVFTADSLEELADKLGIDPDALQRNVNEYNQHCDKGRDDLFMKDPKFLRPVKDPGFYALRLIPAMYGTLGGIKVSERMEVIDKAHEVIPGFYAAGNDSNNMFGDIPDYHHGKFGGSAMGFALISGRIAGEAALEYINRK
jgi:fumarate reductase flavoprotein subunit